MNEEQLKVCGPNLTGSYDQVKTVVSTAQSLSAQKAVREVYMDEKFEKYIL